MISKAPNLEKFSLGEKTSSGWRNCPFFRHSRSAVLRVCQLKNLRHLSLYHAFNLAEDDFIDITKNLKNLVCLKVKLFKNLPGVKKVFRKKLETS